MLQLHWQSLTNALLDKILVSTEQATLVYSLNLLVNAD